MRPVPRNIDRPNRMAEYLAVSLAAYYFMMFTTHDPLIAVPVSGLSVYVMYKVTLDKPEGAFFRMWYRYFSIGRMLPNPREVKKFEI